MMEGSKMSIWETKSIGDLCSRFSSGKNITADRISEQGKYPVYGGNGLRGYTNNYNFDGKCVLIGRQGAYCGNVRYFEGKAFMSEHAIVAVANSENCTRYLAYKFDTMKLGRFSGQAAQPGLSVGKLAKLSIQVPSLPKQEKISSILSTYDNLIEANNRKIDLLEQVAQELYKEWFVRFRFPGYENAKFEDGLPEGWESDKIQKYYNTCSGGTPSRSKPEYFENGIYPWVKTGEIKDCVIIDTEEYITQEAVNSSSAKVLPAKSVAMAMYGVNIGLLAYFDSEMTCNQACCVFSDKRDFSSKHYLYYYLKSIREYLLLISFGAAQQNLSQDLIKKIKITMPSDDVIQAFEKQIDDIYENIKMLLMKNKNLAEQRDMLLPRLMSGKLEV